MIDMTKLTNMYPTNKTNPNTYSAYTSQSQVAPVQQYQLGGGIPPGEPPYKPVKPPPNMGDPVVQPAPDNGNWNNLNWLKNYYGGKWYDFGAKEGQPGWYRAPRINPADAEAVWNQKYGWQDWNTIAGLNGDYSSLTPQFGDVYKIFGGYNTNSPLPGGAPTGTPGWPGYPGTGGTTGTSPAPTTGTGSVTDVGGQYGIQYPGAWNTAGNVLNDFALGLPGDVPAEWETLLNQLGDVWNQGGMPVSQEDWYNQAKEKANVDIKNAIDQANEQYTGLGLRFSTPAIRSAQQIAGDIMAGVGTQYTQQELQALEAAKQRQMQTLPYQYQLGGGIAGLEEQAKQNALNATQQLFNLGQGQWQMPSTLAQQAYQMGGGIYGQTQQGIQNILGEWLRTQGYNNPYLQMALGLGGQTGQYVPNQYAPGGLLGLGICG